MAPLTLGTAALRLIVCAGPALDRDLTRSLAVELTRREGSTRVALVDREASAALAALHATWSTALVVARHAGALLRIAGVLLWVTSTIAPPPTSARAISATTHPTSAYPAPTIRLPADARTLAAALG